VRELRELSMTVAQWSGAIEMPDVVQARDELVRRFLETGPHRRPKVVKPPSGPPTFQEVELEELEVLEVRRSRSGRSRGANGGERLLREAGVLPMPG
jgi:hypothetical protein